MRNYAKDIYDLLERKKPNIWKHQKNNEALKALYPDKDSNEKLKEYTIEKIDLCIKVGVACVLIGLLMWIKEATIKDIVYIPRNNYGEGSKKEELVVKRKDKEEIAIAVELEEKEYTKEEQEKIYEDFRQKLFEEILCENESFEKVTKDLKLYEGIDGYPFSIQWLTDEINISNDGVLLNEKLEEPVISVLEAHISGNNFTRIEEIPCEIYSRDIPFSFEYKLESFIKLLDKEQIKEEKLTLPSVFEGEELTYRKKKSGLGRILFLMGPVLMVILYYCKDKDLDAELRKRQEQIKEDYPGVVSKLALYLGAGLTMNNAWKKIASSDKKNRYIYEEMLITQHEIESGVPISTAYEGFGKRCHENCYTKLVSVILQNKKKGSNNVALQLKDEASLAFELRKQEAVKLGEKAATKMLMPMMLLLLVVLILVMAPAFMNQI